MWGFCAELSLRQRARHVAVGAGSEPQSSVEATAPPLITRAALLQYKQLLLEAL